jgi:hypothetical protein
MGGLARLAALAVLLLPSSAGAAEASGTAPELARLLAASDPFAAAPAELRALLVFSTPTRSARVPLELWRRGDELALVRFLGEKDRGKYVLRRGGSFYLLAPGAARPVKLAPALAPAGGAALGALLAVRPSRDYEIEATREEAGLVTYDLVARPGTTGAPRVRWVVDRERRVPVRAEFRNAEDRVERLVEFKRWSDAERLVPGAIVAKEIARGGLPLEIEFLALEPREAPESLFDLEDGAARAALPLPDLTPPAGSPPAGP